MIVNYFDVKRIAILETKTDAPLIVYADAPLSSSVVPQRFQAIGRRDAQVIELCRGIELCQSHYRPLANLGRPSPRLSGGEEALRFCVGERADHIVIINNMFTFGNSIEIHVV